jgi:hypothetical protein
VLNEDFDRFSGFSFSRTEPDKHRPTMPEFAKGMGNTCPRESEQTWSLFRHPG